MKMSPNGHCAEVLLNDMNAVPLNYFQAKAWPTRVVGALMLLIASPLIVLFVLLVRLTSAGPGLYRQARMGRYGVTFQMYKIRTMYADAESVSGPVWCKPGDSRITPVGKVLRLLHLDELPQLINVARGEMDLIGPRPERPVFVSQLAQEIPHYSARLQVLPGVTGLAQINLPPDETAECVRKKLVLDCAYIREADLFLDSRLLLCTFLRMIGIRHGHAARMLGVHRTVQLSSARTNGSVRTALNWTHSTFSANGTTEVAGDGECLALVATSADEADALGTLDLQGHADHVADQSRRPR